MSARIAITAALVACAAVAYAEAPGSFILTNGQRHDGTVIYGRGDNNIVDGRFHLLEAGSDRSYGIDEVAAIDFVGGTPPANELQALPDSPVMVMRNGSMVRGHLHNIVSNDNVQWVNEGGQRNNYPIREVSRLYLKPSIARQAYGGGAAPAAPVPSSPGSNVIRVDANRPWTDTGITVRRGDRLVFRGTGDIMLAPGVSSGVGGNPALRGLYAVPSASAGALIGRVGSRAFAIGGNAQPITMNANGPLMLGINDDNYADNTGSFTVTVVREN